MTLKWNNQKSSSVEKTVREKMNRGEGLAENNREEGNKYHLDGTTWKSTSIKLKIVGKW